MDEWKLLRNEVVVTWVIGGYFTLMEFCTLNHTILTWPH